jgi:hypothetical protein
MGDIEKVVDVIITRETATVERAGFGRALILGTHTTPADLIKVYSTLEAVEDDFATGTEEYKAAAKLFGQAVKPADLAIGKRSAAVPQVDNIDPTTLENADYTVTLNGVVFTYTPGVVPASKTVVSTALVAAINAGSEPVTAALAGIAPGQTVALTADNAGEPFTAVATTSNLTRTNTTPNNGVQEDLAAIVASGDLGRSWYALQLISRNDWDILEGAIYCQGHKKIFVACSGAAGVKSSGTTDIGYALKAANYDRTALLYSGDHIHYPDAAWLGLMLAKEPGSATWALKTLAGITVDQLTDTEETNLNGKNVNFFVERGGASITQGGKMAQGEWIDVMVGIDWIEARAQEAIFALLVANDKVPFTDAGIAQVVNALEQILVQARDRGILSAYSIQVPKASAFTTVQKQSRELTGITFTGTLAGAVHKVTIYGKVSV